MARPIRVECKRNAELLSKKFGEDLIRVREGHSPLGYNVYAVARCRVFAQASGVIAERLLQLGEGALKKAGLRRARVNGEKRAHGEAEAKAAGGRRNGRRWINGGGTEEIAGQRGSQSSDRKKGVGSGHGRMPWIAKWLHMRNRANASQQIRRHRLAAHVLPKSLKRWSN
jgi:hypothetical protein